MRNKEPKRKGSCLISILVIFLIFIIMGAIIAVIESSSKKESSSTGQQTETAELTDKAEEPNTVDPTKLFEEAQNLLSAGKYKDAVQKIDEVISIKEDQEYKDFKVKVEEEMNLRKTELENSFEVNEDKVENVSFIKPTFTAEPGLIFYPYIGIKDSDKYMLLRIGYQEDVTTSLMVFTKIKIRTGDTLIDVKYNPMDKKNNVDIMGSGMTEVIDVAVKDDILALLETEIPKGEEVVVRFEDISNTSKDYVLTESQTKVIADIMEYYSYLD